MDCDGCTLCCKLLPVPWMNSPFNEYCSECNIGVGCKIWDNVDERCKEFSCAYNQIEKCSKNMKPDKCGIIFEKLTDEIFIGTVDNDKGLTNDAKGQIIQFLNEGFSVVLFCFGKQPVIHEANGHDGREIWEVIKQKREELKNG